MELKDLNKISKYAERIKMLDKEIISIEKLAIQAAEDEIEVSLSFDITDIKKKQEKEVKAYIDCDDEEESPMHRYLMGGFISHLRQSLKEDDSNSKFSQKITGNMLLQILGILLAEKQHQRQLLLKKLNNMGIK